MSGEGVGRVEGCGIGGVLCCVQGLGLGSPTPMVQGRSTKIISMIKLIQTSRLSIKNSLLRVGCVSRFEVQIEVEGVGHPAQLKRCRTERAGSRVVGVGYVFWGQGMQGPIGAIARDMSSLEG